ncbi:MAG: GGDEF domain-containing protein [Deltaproteobacteria bacterium]|nr:GGDEF domain-containing protein [Deltaproteobacteria bacterium]
MNRPLLNPTATQPVGAKPRPHVRGRTFDAATEAIFRQRRIERALPTIRFGCIGASIIFAAFFLRDRYLAPDRESITLTIRLVVCGFFLLLVPVTQIAGFHRLIPYFVPFASAFASACVSLICTLLPSGFDIGIGGPLLVIMAAPAVSPTAMSAIVMCLLGVAIPNLAMLATGQPWLTVFSTNHYLVMGGALSMGIAILLERDARRAFSLEVELETAATTDPLTGVFNRRRFLDLAEAEVARARRYGHALSVIMFDLDHFKQINDRHGHHGGDQVLRVFPSRIDKHLRRNDTLGRLGGEEFAIVLPETDRGAAVAAAERVRAAIAAATIPVGSTAVALTLSAGCAELAPDDPDFDALLRRADAALYRAKRAGRNRVELG